MLCWRVSVEKEGNGQNRWRSLHCYHCSSYLSENLKETKKEVLVDAGYCDDSLTDAGWMLEILSLTVNEYVVDFG